MQKKILPKNIKNFKITKNYVYFFDETAFNKKNKQKGLVAAFSLKGINYDLRTAQTKDEHRAIITARKKIFTDLNLDYKKGVFLGQVHKNKIALISYSQAGAGFSKYEESVSQTDGAITNDKGIVLCLLSADCLPIIFWDPKQQVIAIAHAGWQGTKQKITLKVLRKMQLKFKTQPRQIRVFFGPGIGVCCYEVSAQFKKIFPDSIREDKKTRKIYLDLVKANKVLMHEFGVKSNHIFSLNLCTKCHSDFFYSYRLGKTKKRMLSLVSLPED